MCVLLLLYYSTTREKFIVSNFTEAGITLIKLK